MRTVVFRTINTALLMLAVVLAGTTLAPAQAADAATATRTTTVDVNLRKGPGISYAVIKVVRAGTTVTLTGKASNGYTQVKAGSSTGYISSRYLASTGGSGSSGGSLPKVVGTRVATAKLSLRATSDPEGKILVKLAKGSTVSITGVTTGDRAQIVYKSAVRWVNATKITDPKVSQPPSPTLPKITGTRYATADLNVRSGSSDSSSVVTVVPKGTALSITGVEANSRSQVVYNNAVRWVTTKYLSSTKPSGSSGGGGGGGTPNPAVERGLQPNAVKTYRAVIKQFPQITSVGSVRADAIPDHPSGRALDLMIPNYKSASGKKLGSDVAAWLKANSKTLGVNYVIWDQHIWNITRDKEGWRYMASRGSDSANHKNHVHVTVFAG